MNTLLEDLYLGNLSPIDFPHTKTEEYQQKSKQFTRESDAFRMTLRELNLHDSFDTLFNQHVCLDFYFRMGSAWGCGSCRRSPCAPPKPSQNHTVCSIKSKWMIALAKLFRYNNTIL